MKSIKRTERKTLARQLSIKIHQVYVLYDVDIKELSKCLGYPEATVRGWADGVNCPLHREKLDAIHAKLDELLEAKGSHDPVYGSKVTMKEIAAGREEPSALDVQVGGSHYKDSSIQPIQYIEANNLNFLEGCILKRITRHNKDTGKGREDIEKVIHEAQLILDLRYPST